MGSGKSRFGKRFAKRMNYTFLDSDREIEKENNSTIGDLFEQIGEEGFRKLETDWLRNFNEEGVVVALGGGTPCNNNNMDLVKEKGISIYLKLPPKILVDRLQDSKDVRPLIVPYAGNSPALTKYIEVKLKEREQFYNEADYTITGMNLNAKRMDELKEMISED